MITQQIIQSTEHQENFRKLYVGFVFATGQVNFYVHLRLEQATCRAAELLMLSSTFVSCRLQ